MSYQGFLVDGNGNALGQTAPANYDVTFSIWDAQTGGHNLWSESQTITVDKGYFSVLLGEGIASQSSPALSTLFTDSGASERYVEITVKGIGGTSSGDLTIAPRLRLLTSPYAFLARHAVNMTGAATINVNSEIKADSFSGKGTNLTGIDTNSLVQEVVEALCPAGTIIAYAGTAIPAGWLLCDGRSLDVEDYPKLYAAIGKNWGSSGANQFNLPDLRGMFLRGVSGTRTDNYRDLYPASRTASASGGNVGNAVGSVRLNTLAVHRHVWGFATDGNDFQRTLQSWNSGGHGLELLAPFVPGSASGTGDDDSMRVAYGARGQNIYTNPDSTEQRDGETYPNNAYVNYIIKK